jgi:hypothetical protein
MTVHDRVDPIERTTNLFNSKTRSRPAVAGVFGHDGNGVLGVDPRGAYTLIDGDTGSPRGHADKAELKRLVPPEVPDTPQPVLHCARREEAVVHDRYIGAEE